MTLTHKTVRKTLRLSSASGGVIFLLTVTYLFLLSGCDWEVGDGTIEGTDGYSGAPMPFPTVFEESALGVTASAVPYASPEPQIPASAPSAPRPQMPETASTVS